MRLLQDCSLPHSYEPNCLLVCTIRTEISFELVLNLLSSHSTGCHFKYPAQNLHNITTVSLNCGGHNVMINGGFRSYNLQAFGLNPSPPNKITSQADFSHRSNNCDHTNDLINITGMKILNESQTLQIQISWLLRSQLIWIYMFAKGGNFVLSSIMVYIIYLLIHLHILTILSCII